MSLLIRRPTAEERIVFEYWVQSADRKTTLAVSIWKVGFKSRLSALGSSVARDLKVGSAEPSD